MGIELITIIALVIAIIIGSLRTDINAGIVSIALALLIGYYAAGFSITELTSVFPNELFLILVGITLLFYMTNENGTLEKISKDAIWLIHGKSFLIPVFLFLFTFSLSAIGPGNIAAVAIIAPLGIAVGYKFKINPLLSSIMICTGANAGTFSPVSPTGIISTSLLKNINPELESLNFTIFVYTALFQAFSAMVAYFIFKGYKVRQIGSKKQIEFPDKPATFTKKQLVTLILINVLILSVIIFNVPIGLGAYTLVIIFSIFKLGKLDKSLKEIPWSPILLVTGISVLIGLIEKTGGLIMATDFIAKNTPDTFINSIFAFVTGLISLYSSSSGVVLPTFMNLIPGIISKLNNVNVTELVIAINVGSHMVDVSPLSTLGALCLAAVNEEDRNKVFRQLLIWGFSMLVFSTIMAYIFLDLF
ncbi:MAG TPA: SLC13 family permease [Ignavibacteria bacterium]|nr:SLC13 family permease [Ignavibacteria bacterium]